MGEKVLKARKGWCFGALAWRFMLQFFDDPRQGRRLSLTERSFCRAVAVLSNIRWFCTEWDLAETRHFGEPLRNSIAENTAEASLKTFSHRQANYFGGCHSHTWDVHQARYE